MIFLECIGSRACLSATVNGCIPEECGFFSYMRPTSSLARAGARKSQDMQKAYQPSYPLQWPPRQAERECAAIANTIPVSLQQGSRPLVRLAAFLRLRKPFCGAAAKSSGGLPPQGAGGCPTHICLKKSVFTKSGCPKIITFAQMF